MKQGIHRQRKPIITTRSGIASQAQPIVPDSPSMKRAIVHDRMEGNCFELASLCMLSKRLRTRELADLEDECLDLFVAL